MTIEKGSDGYYHPASEAELVELIQLANGTTVTKRDHDFDIGVRRRDIRKPEDKGGVLRKEECAGFLIEVGSVLIREELLTLADLDGMSENDFIAIGLSR